MGTISLRNAGHRAGDLLFSDLNLVIADGDHVGLVAPNGRGKSTLLRAMAGQLELSEGELTRSRGLLVGYVPQDVAPAALGIDLHTFVADGLGPEQRETEAWRAEMVLEEFEIPSALRSRPLGELSGGWQRMALLARCWVREPNALLLDEPTNHLDLGRVGFVERWLSYAAKDLPVVIASHDRAFLDATTNRTLFLRPSEQPFFPLPFSKARSELDRLDEAAEAHRERDLKQAAQLRRQAATLTNIGINSGSDLLTVKSRQLRERADRIEGQVQSVHKDRTGVVRLGNSGADARIMLSFAKVEVATPDGRMLFVIDRLRLFQGERMVVLGRNGAGKSRLMALLTSALGGAEVEGLRISPQVAAGYMDQGLAWLPLDEAPFDFLAARSGDGDRRIIALLAGAGFSPERQTRPIATLSLGQRARLALLALRLARPNFYLLDEPTNHLDIPGQEQLEADIVEEGATVVLVSHDRTFLRSIGTRYFEIKGRRLVEVDGPEAFLDEQEKG
ncbi:ABC-F family ATP-binding cassette domain-containing protein [Devosia sp. PTR5]|uniref:ABC-F family ATP-binding cassette domain-containing protein n=1 Tax=Devosia oryzisoli TaxID=2774138 RepID=A0A927FQS3_9HYPH|nr:ATP-binding cassette domain-containing protein [Devosia oryzisoli]MBD8064535.1 ABC-F family ATP-binding cassette domain-containing protein [Devosia oryzisoli]